jgi:hypothetical protein
MNHYMLLELFGRSYHKCNDTHNNLIDMLSMVFTDHGPNGDWVLRYLLDPDSRGVVGSKTSITIEGEKVTLEPSTTMVDNPEDYAVEIDRKVLIRLTNEWQALVDQGAPNIYIYYKDGKYGVADVLPAEVE